MSDDSSGPVITGQGIDWSDIHRRLSRLDTTIDSNWRRDPQQAQIILQQRARELAAPTVAAATADLIELLEFSLARERYGIASAYVREVCALTQFTPVPCTPAFVMGIINLRGEIISVIDIRKLFGLPERGLPDLNKVIILEDVKDEVFAGGARRMTFGILADFIVDVRAVDKAELQPAASISGIRGDYLNGVTAQGMAVIDAEKLLGDKTIVVDDAASS